MYPLFILKMAGDVLLGFKGLKQLPDSGVLAVEDGVKCVVERLKRIRGPGRSYS